MTGMDGKSCGKFQKECLRGFSHNLSNCTFRVKHTRFFLEKMETERNAVMSLMRPLIFKGTA